MVMINIFSVFNSVPQNIIERFLYSFDINCVDKSIANIYFVTDDAIDNITKNYEKLNIHILNSNDILGLDDIIHTNCDLLKFMAVDHIYSENDNENMYSLKCCVFPINLTFIRRFSLSSYVNCSNIYYHYKFSQCLIIPNEINDMSVLLKQLLGNHVNAAILPNNIWFNESLLYVYDTTIISEIFGKIKSIYNGSIDEMCRQLPKIYFDYCYHGFIYGKQKNEFTSNIYNSCDIFDVLLQTLSTTQMKLLQQYMSIETNGKKLSDTFEVLVEKSYAGIEIVKNIFMTMNIGTYGYKSFSMNHIIFLLTHRDILFCCCEDDEIFQKILYNNGFNMKIAVGISGLIRKTDNINTIYNFLHLCSFDLYFYISTQENIKSKSELFNDGTIKQQMYIKKFIIDNSSKHQTVVAKYKQPHTRDDMVINTCEMMYKKYMLYNVILQSTKHYDFIISIRPDLLSLDGKYLMNILVDILVKYNMYTIYVPKIYNSVGVTDTMACGSNAIMTTYFKMYEKISVFLESYYFNPEYITYKYLINNGIRIDVFNWNYIIYRHTYDRLIYWWRYEFDIEKCVCEYLRLKVSSLETLNNDNNFHDKHHIIHMKTGKFLSFHGGNANLSLIRDTHFEIYRHPDKIIRCCIKVLPIKYNIANSFMSVVNNHISLCDNDATLNSQFYLIKRDEYYFIVTTASHYQQNISGLFGCYIGMSGENIICDMNECENSIWMIK